MGFAIAEAAARAGAQVTLIAGPVHLPTPPGVHRKDVTTAQEMHDAVMRCLDAQPADIFIGVAAVADWRPDKTRSGKMKKSEGQGLDEISWVENPDILATVARRSPAPLCIGFAAESGSISDLETLLPEKRVRKQVPLLVGNIGADTFGEDNNQIMLCDAHGTTLLPKASKFDLACQLISHIASQQQSHS